MVITTTDLRCSYGDFEAVRGVDLEIHQGEICALLGTNGAGKTTTLETLEGHRPPTAGVISVLGGDPRTLSRRRRMGIMLQESGFAGDLSVTETVDMCGHVVGRRDDISSLLDRVGLARKRGTRVSQLSGGEKRRLDFVLAIYGKPELLFLDEPTTGLDPESRIAM